MKEAVYAIYGASGFGREVMPLVRDAVENGSQIYFVDDGVSCKSINGYEVLTYSEFLAIDSAKKFMNVAIANSIVREKLVKSCLSDAVKLFSISAKNVVIMDEVDLASGAILSPFVTLTSNIKIGCSFQANLYSYVAHDCVIGDYVTFAPSVKCNGNVVIEDHAYIGTGAIIKQGQPGNPIVIGRGAVVGMGAVVTKSVPAGLTVIGNPAKPFIKRI